MVNAFAVNVRWQSTDFQTGAATTGSQTQIQGSTSTGSSSSSSSSKISIVGGSSTSSGFPISAAVGITIGVMLVVILAVWGACLFFYKRRGTRSSALLDSKRNYNEVDDLASGLAIGKPDVAFKERIYMLAGSDVAEVEGGRNRPLNEMA